MIILSGVERNVILENILFYMKSICKLCKKKTTYILLDTEISAIFLKF